MDAVLKRTTKEDQKIAQSSIIQFRIASKKVIKRDSRSAKIKFQGSEDFVRIPKKAIALLFDIVNNMAEGRSNTLIPSVMEVGTQRAADMLNMSRPHLVKLLEEGKIPYIKVGAHRRIELKDLVAYDNRIKETRNEQLDFLAKQAQDLNLGY